MYEGNQVGVTKRVTVAGVTVLSSVNSNVLGVACNASVTGRTTIQFWAGTTATATSNGKTLSGVLTFVSATATALAPFQYLRFPAYSSGGCVVNIAGDANPDITLFWNPA